MLEVQNECLTTARCTFLSALTLFFYMYICVPFVVDGQQVKLCLEHLCAGVIRLGIIDFEYKELNDAMESKVSSVQSDCVCVCVYMCVVSKSDSSLSQVLYMSYYPQVVALKIELQRTQVPLNVTAVLSCPLQDTLPVKIWFAYPLRKKRNTEKWKTCCSENKFLNFKVCFALRITIADEHKNCLVDTHHQVLCFSDQK